MGMWSTVLLPMTFEDILRGIELSGVWGGLSVYKNTSCIPR